MDLLSKDRSLPGTLGCVRLVAVAVMAVALGGCYSPELQDCVVACTAAADCGPGQACGGDGWCAGGDVIGQCQVPIEPPIEPPMGAGDELRVVIAGQGKVEIETSSLTGQSVKETCTSTSSTGATCAYPTSDGMWATLRQKEGGGWRFDGWSWIACTLGKPKSCLVRTGTGSTVVNATFIMQ
jgi:hypothetical protein